MIDIRKKALIKAAFERGELLTTYKGNRIGHTTEFRKIVSNLRSEGYPISDHWMEKNGVRFKVYYKTTI